ncbi:farnesol dehydrogenase-like [Cylas formicarius]|uniref:farnesol dehydrogenase-like n=1 Tax=Cylas formicarius TaxID=197179 RepID=UPI002958DF4E|nr:farnesol dehydrogenase-like [Cylas formicarius]
MVLSLDRWVGKVAVVTGASAGIGAAVSEALVKNGINVAGLARRQGPLDAMANKLKGLRGKFYPVQADLSKEEDVKKGFKWVLDNVGPVAILVNNAGVYFPNTLIDGDAQKWKQTFDTNVLGVCVATREAIKQMKDHKIDGHIFHMNAILGHRVQNIPNFSVNPACKFAITALAETLRYEINGQNLKIKITSISPGYVETTLKIPGLKGLNPEDIADAIVYGLSTPPHVQVSEITVQIINDPM